MNERERMTSCPREAAQEQAKSARIDSIEFKDDTLEAAEGSAAAAAATDAGLFIHCHSTAIQLPIQTPAHSLTTSSLNSVNLISHPTDV